MRGGCNAWPPGTGAQSGACARAETRGRCVCPCVLVDSEAAIIEAAGLCAGKMPVVSSAVCVRPRMLDPPQLFLNPRPPCVYVRVVGYTRCQSWNKCLSSPSRVRLPLPWRARLPDVRCAM